VGFIVYQTYCSGHSASYPSEMGKCVVVWARWLGRWYVCAAPLVMLSTSVDDKRSYHYLMPMSCCLRHGKPRLRHVKTPVYALNRAAIYKQLELVLFVTHYSWPA